LICAASIALVSDACKREKDRFAASTGFPLASVLWKRVRSWFATDRCVEDLFSASKSPRQFEEHQDVAKT
jgi:hypothetical protein